MIGDSKGVIGVVDRSGHSQMFFKTGVLKMSQILTENTCVGVSF